MKIKSDEDPRSYKNVALAIISALMKNSEREIPPDHLLLDHAYLVGNLRNSKVAETKALEPVKS
jgi:hypothetical protein